MTEKMILIAFLFGGVLLYSLMDTRANARHDFRSSADSLIPFVSQMIYPYLALFVFVPITLLLLILTKFAVPYIEALDIAMYTGALSWFLLPAKMHHPHVYGKTISEKLVLAVYKDNPHANAFPSAHVFSSLITAYYLSLAIPAYSALAWLVAIVIALSTMFVKRHSIKDVGAAIVWALCAILLVQNVIPLL